MTAVEKQAAEELKTFAGQFEITPIVVPKNAVKI
jgi:hypothetical protein